MGPVVVLRKEEIIEAGVGGLMRRTRAIMDGRYQPITPRGAMPKSFGPDVDGAIGEKAVAKFLNRYWSATCVKDLKSIGGDVGKGVEVKTSGHLNAHLMVPKDAADDAAYVLVIADPPRYTLRGWILGRNGKRAEWGRHDGPGVPFTYWVPQEALNAMETLVTHLGVTA